MELIYFSDISQLDYVLAEQPELLRDMRPITGDIVVSFELERLEIDHIDEWDLIEPDEIEKNWNESYELSKSWWDERLASTLYGIEALTVSAQQDMVYPFQACLNARTAYGRLLKKFPIEKITGFFLPPVAVIRTGPAPTSRAVRSVSEAVLIYIAEKRGIPLVKLRSNQPLSKGKANRFGHSNDNNLEEIKKYSEKYLRRKAVLIYKDGLRSSELAVIKKTVERMGDVTPVFISQEDLKIGSDLKNSNLLLEHRLNLFWSKFIEYSENYSGEYPEIFSNSHLYFQFKRIKEEMQAAVEYGDVWGTLLDAVKPAAVIFGFESFTIERVLVGLAQTKNIFVMAMLHGGVMPTMAIRGVAGIADAIMVWNDRDVHALSSYGVALTRLKKIGCIQYEESYLKYANNLLKQQALNNISNQKRRLGFQSDKPLIALVTAEINTGFAAAVANPRKHRVALKELTSLLDRRPDLQFVIKPHPSFDTYELYRRLINDERPNLKFLEQTNLSDVLDASDICLMINYSTTASLEAMLNKIPVIYLNNAIYKLSDWRDNLSDAGVCRVETTLDMENAIDQLLTDCKFRFLTLIEAEKQLNDIIGWEEKYPSERFVEFLRSVLIKTDANKSDNSFRYHALYDCLLDNLLNNFHTKIGSSKSPAVLLYVHAYVAGINGFGYSSIVRTYKLCHDAVGAYELPSWATVRSELILAYIKGSLARSGFDHLSFSNLMLLIPYVTNPIKLFQYPHAEKKLLVKFFIFNLFGQLAPNVFFITNALRRVYFGIFR